MDEKPAGVNFKNLYIREYQGHKKKVHSVAWNCVGMKVASGSVDHTARVWNVDPHGHGKVKDVELKGHTDSVDQLCWDPKHTELVATAAGDKTVRLWDARSGKCSQLVELSGENINVTYNPDGTHIAVGNKVPQQELGREKVGRKNIPTTGEPPPVAVHQTPSSVTFPLDSLSHAFRSLAVNKEKGGVEIDKATGVQWCGPCRPGEGGCREVRTAVGAPQGSMASPDCDPFVFFPILVGLMGPPQGREGDSSPTAGQIVLVNPLTQGMVVLQTGWGGSDLVGLMQEMLAAEVGECGLPRASKVSIKAMLLSICISPRLRCPLLGWLLPLFGPATIAAGPSCYCCLRPGLGWLPLASPAAAAVAPAWGGRRRP
ncbi:hypothetical protein Taro_034225 [Colocasia esculenta]|uniref:Uncharacterized protein n=1 Tax=Colocasia esculenta TaxID=4460 RepID=A0A843W6Y4_COLES|nr:hypothetical protein [Colocasia esculenta]